MRAVVVFKKGLRNDGGNVVIGYVTEWGYDAGTPVEGEFTVTSVDGNTVHFTTGPSEVPATMVKVSDDRALFNGTLEMIRVRK
ncbi:MAG: hypothetical protein QHI48_06215 [Bacteroidota bacterium]|nr:hypothetical protein [Bacteroidota bacterium]